MSEHINKVVKFVVRRDNHRVSDKLWDSKIDAEPEFIYWSNIVNRINDGTDVTIEPFELKDDYQLRQ